MQIKYELCSLMTVDGIVRAEQLQEDGWAICESTPFSVTMKKEDIDGQRKEYTSVLSEA